eukprot:TRINITY_DN1791_c0_g1_i4.p1 TRINITY_DN1791_c0_g1~~TRINITY_DN1791_c0_g1_i4.p1  ORF type:complete len:184 (-),score=26.34 TRINITY_DN1791_c0_g1_i4:281-751(-)
MTDSSEQGQDRPPEPESPSSTEGKKKEKNKKSMTFDKVLTTFYKRPSEQIGRTALTDKYRHESMGTFEEGWGREQSISRTELPETSTPRGKSVPTISVSTLPTTSGIQTQASPRNRGKSTSKAFVGDEWDLYDHQARDTTAPKEEEQLPSSCCIIA